MNTEVNGHLKKFHALIWNGTVSEQIPEILKDYCSRFSKFTYNMRADSEEKMYINMRNQTHKSSPYMLQKFPNQCAQLICIEN